MDLLTRRCPLGDAVLGPERAGELDRAIERHPAHQLRVQEVLRLPADLPDALVALHPSRCGGVGGVDEEGARGRVEATQLVDQAARGAEELAVDVELTLGPCAIADAHRTAVAPSREMIEGAFGQVMLTADAEHDLQIRTMTDLCGDRARHPGEEAIRLVGTCRDPQGLEGEARVAHPGVAVVPVALATDCLWQ